MPSSSKAQAAYFESLYANPALAKQHGIDMRTVKEWVEEDRKLGTKHLPETSGTKTSRSSRRK